MSNKNTILALDQGSKISGYAIYSGGTLVASGILKANTKDSSEDRMFTMASQIERLIKDYAPQELVVEEPFAKVNLRVFQVMCELLGIVTYIGYKSGLKVSSYSAAVWRSRLGIKGKNRAEQKALAISTVKDSFQIDCTDDEAEAILIGYTHIKS